MKIPAFLPSFLPLSAIAAALPEEAEQTAATCEELFSTIIPALIGVSIAYCLFQCCCCCRSAPEKQQEPALPPPRSRTSETNESSAATLKKRVSFSASTTTSSASTLAAPFSSKTAVSAASSSRTPSPINYSREDLLFDIQILTRNALSDLYQQSSYGVVLGALAGSLQNAPEDPFLLAMDALLRYIHKETAEGSNADQWDTMRSLLVDALKKRPLEPKKSKALQALLLELCYLLTTCLTKKKDSRIPMQVNQHTYTKQDSRDTFDLVTLRLPSPFDSEKLDPIFCAFLERAKQKKKRILYISHLPDGPRLTLFRQLAKDFPNTFYALRLPVKDENIDPSQFLKMVGKQLTLSGFDNISALQLRHLFESVKNRYKIALEIQSLPLQTLFYFHLKELLAQRYKIAFLALPAEQWAFHKQFPLIERAAYCKKLPSGSKIEDTSALVPTLEHLKTLQLKKLPPWESEGWSSSSP